MRILVAELGLRFRTGRNQLSALLVGLVEEKGLGEPTLYSFLLTFRQTKTRPTAAKPTEIDMALVYLGAWSDV